MFGILQTEARRYQDNQSTERERERESVHLKHFDQLELSTPFYFKAFQLSQGTIIIEHSITLLKKHPFFL
jgi:hypothetical protein